MIFRKKGKKGKYLKIWSKMYKIWKNFEGQPHACNYQKHEIARICPAKTFFTNCILKNNSATTSFYTTVKNLREEYKEQWKAWGELLKTDYSLFQEEISACALVRTCYVIGACNRVKSIILLPLMMGHHWCLSR